MSWTANDQRIAQAEGWQMFNGYPVPYFVGGDLNRDGKLTLADAEWWIRKNASFGSGFHRRAANYARISYTDESRLDTLQALTGKLGIADG